MNEIGSQQKEDEELSQEVVSNKGTNATCHYDNEIKRFNIGNRKQRRVIENIHLLLAKEEDMVKKKLNGGIIIKEGMILVKKKTNRNKREGGKGSIITEPKGGDTYNNDCIIRDEKVISQELWNIPEDMGVVCTKKKVMVGKVLELEQKDKIEIGKKKSTREDEGYVENFL